jgi:hypothetical protein
MKKRFFEKLIGMKFNVEDQRSTTLNVENAISQSECLHKILMREI